MRICGYRISNSMKLPAILEKCYTYGEEKCTSVIKTYTLKEDDCTHTIQLFIKNYGKNKINTVIYTREICGNVVYEWKGDISETPIQKLMQQQI